MSRKKGAFTCGILFLTATLTCSISSVIDFFQGKILQGSLAGLTALLLLVNAILNFVEYRGILREEAETGEVEDSPKSPFPWVAHLVVSILFFASAICWAISAALRLVVVNTVPGILYIVATLISLLVSVLNFVLFLRTKREYEEPEQRSENENV